MIPEEDKFTNWLTLLFILPLLLTSPLNHSNDRTVLVIVG